MKLKNNELPLLIDLLDDMALAGRPSLGRSKLKKALVEKGEEYSKEQYDVVEEYDAWTDKAKGLFSNDNDELREALTDLGLTDIEVNVSGPFFMDFVNSLENYDGELSGANADSFAYLYENLVEEGEHG